MPKAPFRRGSRVNAQPEKPALPQAEIHPQRRRIRRKQALPLQFTVTAPSREKAVG